MKSDNNKFLKVRKLVNLTPTIDEAIALLDGYFEQANIKAEVSDGLRTQAEQLKLIIKKCLKHKIDKEFPLIRAAKLNDKETWVNAWGRLLTIGEMINPPIATAAPFDYKKSDGTLRKAGTVIPMSGHQYGADFDISGYNQELNINVSLQSIANVIATFLKNPMSGNEVSGYLIEPVNGAVHVDCVQIKLDNF
jgi:hypothetical protein